MQAKFEKKAAGAQGKSIQQIKSAIKESNKKTLILDLDNCLLNAVYKKKELIDYDATTYVKLIGQNNFKLYLQYRPYMKEML